jgi:hypothetical protein
MPQFPSAIRSSRYSIRRWTVWPAPGRVKSGWQRWTRLTASTNSPSGVWRSVRQTPGELIEYALARVLKTSDPQATLNCVTSSPIAGRIEG